MLREVLELSEGEMSGSASLKHLPPDERQHIVSNRQTDLEFLRSRLDLQITRSQQQDLLLEENQKEINTLRYTLFCSCAFIGLVSVFDSYTKQELIMK